MYVYFIKAGSSPPMLKIGKANNPQVRLVELQTGCPFKLELLGTLKCKSPMHSRTVEKQLHRLFRKEKQRGEWFRFINRLPFVVKEILREADATDVRRVFNEALGNAIKVRKPEVEIEYGEIDRESLSHLRAIRAEGLA